MVHDSHKVDDLPVLHLFSSEAARAFGVGAALGVSEMPEVSADVLAARAKLAECGTSDVTLRHHPNSWRHGGSAMLEIDHDGYPICWHGRF